MGAPCTLSVPGTVVRVVKSISDASECEQKLVISPFAARVSVEPCSEFTKKGYVTARLFVIRWVLVVDVEPIEAVIFEQTDGGRDKLGPQSRVYDHWVEVGGVGPASDGEDDL